MTRPATVDDYRIDIEYTPRHPIRLKRYYWRVILRSGGYTAFVAQGFARTRGGADAAALRARNADMGDRTVGGDAA